MPIEQIRSLCHAHLNKPVEIRMLDGAVHRGVITRVDADHVWLRPLDDGIDPPPGVDGPGIYWFGWGWGWPIAIAGIAAIAAIALAGFWWW